jgi:formylglycine-generating enzyme required for sulfatase activity
MAKFHGWILSCGILSCLLFSFHSPNSTAAEDADVKQIGSKNRAIATLEQIPPGPKGTVAKSHGSNAGEQRDDNGLQMKFIWCPPGTFTMGTPKSTSKRSSDDEEAVTVTVTLTRGFWLGKYEVTQSNWEKVMKTSPWDADPWKDGTVRVGPDFPVTFVDYDDAVQFCRRLTDQERRAGRLPAGFVYTLPTEAQWEYACRAGTQDVYSFGNSNADLYDYAWFGGKWGGSAIHEKYAHQVGLKRANPWGLYDMHGNVAEWCRDDYVKKLPGGTDPEVVSGGSARVTRGGDWLLGDCRSAGRCHTWKAGDRLCFVGFRAALRQE